MRRGRVVLAVGFALVAIPRLAAGGALADVIKARQARLNAILDRNPGQLPAPEREHLKGVLTDTLDVPAMAESALGAEWSKRSQVERNAYVQAFEGLVRASLLRKPEIYRIEAVQYGQETIEGKRGRVLTTVRSKDTTTEVTYEFREGALGWRIVDYTIDGVSTVRNYRSQFSKILTKSGWNGLIERLRNRTRDIEKEG